VPPLRKLVRPIPLYFAWPRLDRACHFPISPASSPKEMGQVAVELSSVWTGYGSTDALSGVSLTARTGELCAVLGPNGAGKSTLVKLLSGALRPRRGKVSVFGVDIETLDRRAISRLVAVVPQQVEVAFGFSVREVVMMGRAPHQGAWMSASPADQKAVDRAIDACGLGDLAARPVAELSGGEQKRAAIARALAQQAQILLLDEAGAHLDVRHAISIHEVVRRELAQRELACIAVLHDLNLAAQYADRVALLKEGGIVAEGTVADVMTYRKLKDVFETELYVGVNELDDSRYFLPMRVRPPSG
jgi:iron complex transport system ATP-binding protein